MGCRFEVSVGGWAGLMVLGGLLVTGMGPAVLQAQSTAVESPAQALELILQVDHAGAGNAEAQAAVQLLQQQSSEQLLPLLDAMETANPLAVNWLRNAFETIAERTVKQGQSLPQAELLAFLADKSHRPASRRLVFEWIRRTDPEQAATLIPGFLTDPSDELRREAVQRLISQAQELTAEADTARQRELWQLALTGASDDDQVRQIVKGLKKFEVEVDLHRHYGLLTTWQLIGPFDNKDEKGFPVVYPPEQEIDLNAEYTGQLGPVRWQPYETTDAYGELNLATAVGPHKGAILYAYTEFNSDVAQPVEFRLATPNAWKVWLNGKLLFEREEYHRGTFFDQYRISGQFQPGVNTILLKTCQNEQEQSWAQDWKVQFRVCNPYGMAVTENKPDNK